MITNRSAYGPFHSGSQLHGLSDTLDLPLSETIAWHDGPIYAIAHNGARVFLRVDDNTGPVGEVPSEGFPVRMRQVVHFLEFPTAEAAKATLLEETSPTRESYERAKSIIREVTTWDLLGPSRGSDYRCERLQLELQDFISEGWEDELPNPKYQPSEPGPAALLKPKP